MGGGSRYAAKRRAREEREQAEAKQRQPQRPERDATPKRRGRWAPDPSDTDDSQVIYVQPYQATKSYFCPGCNQEIPPSTGHMVAVPPEAPDLRRHWHRACWNNRHTHR